MNSEDVSSKRSIVSNGSVDGLKNSELRHGMDSLMAERDDLMFATVFNSFPIPHFGIEQCNRMSQRARVLRNVVNKINELEELLEEMYDQLKPSLSQLSKGASEETDAKCVFESMLNEKSLLRDERPELLCLKNTEDNNVSEDAMSKLLMLENAQLRDEMEFLKKMRETFLFTASTTTNVEKTYTLPRDETYVANKVQRLEGLLVKLNDGFVQLLTQTSMNILEEISILP